jgi:hypothetical protein
MGWNMAKRLMLVVVGAGMGSLVGLLLAAAGAGAAGIVICAALGAVVPLLVLGSPGK